MLEYTMSDYSKITMPFKSQTMTQGASLSQAIIASNRDAQQRFAASKKLSASDSSLYIANRRRYAVAESVLNINDRAEKVSFTSYDPQLANRELRLTRNSGSVPNIVAYKRKEALKSQQ